MLKVLLMDSFKFNKIHCRLGYHFLSKLGHYCDLTLYGSNELEVKESVDSYFTDKINFVEHKNGQDFDDVLNECGKPDVILTHQYIASNSLKPNEFDDNSIPKAILLFDTYVNEDNSSNRIKAEFVKNYNYDLVIRRGCKSFYDDDLWETPSVWLPFSVREENFYTDPTTRYLYGRQNNITFVGAGYESRNVLYSTLKKSINTLKNEDLMFYQGIVGLDAYPNAIKRCVLALSYSFEQYRGHPAKLFELMGSGTGVLTKPFDYKKALFGEEDICWFYHDQEDLKNLANKLLSDIERPELYRVTGNALRIINERHLDKHRVPELVSILEALAEGSQIPSKWE